MDWRAKAPHASTPGSLTLFSSLVASSGWLVAGLKKMKKMKRVVVGAFHWLVMKDGGIQNGRLLTPTGSGVRERDSCICRCRVNGEHSLILYLHYTFQ